jgi:hypothetical protein
LAKALEKSTLGQFKKLEIFLSFYPGLD